MSSISHLHARQILDSRGNPTIEVEVTLSDGSFGRSAIPSGASTGSREALELRDGGAAYLGKGVLKAVGHVTQQLQNELRGHDLDQASLDQRMIELDSTKTKSRLGANAILGVSMAFAVATAVSRKQPLYQYLAELSNTPQPKLPQPTLNVLNGGAHANWTTDIQEYMLVPRAGQSYSDQLRSSVEVFHHLGKLLQERNLSVHVGNEGGYAPALESNEQAFSVILEAIEAAGYSAATDGDFTLAIDAAASEFYQDGKYQLKRDGVTKTSEEIIDWMSGLTTTYPISSLEDPLADEDWESWKLLTQQIGEKITVVGDDLLVTNPEYIKRAIEERSCNAVLIKLNQIGTLTETLEAIRLTKEAGWKHVISHRSGETEDTFIAHLAVGTAAEQIKTGAPSRSERTAKYNELLRIEEAPHNT